MVTLKPNRQEEVKALVSVGLYSVGIQLFSADSTSVILICNLYSICVVGKRDHPSVIEYCKFCFIQPISAPQGEMSLSSTLVLATGKFYVLTAVNSVRITKINMLIVLSITFVLF